MSYLRVDSNISKELVYLRSLDSFMGKQDEWEVKDLNNSKFTETVFSLNYAKSDSQI